MAKNEERDEPILDEAGDEALARLSDQVDRAIGLIRDLTRQRDGLEEQLRELQARLDELESNADRTRELEAQQSAMEREKAQIRGRIEAILEKFEELDSDE